MTNKNSKCLFHLFNKYQESRNRSKQFIRYSVISDDNYALKELQNRNWPYFINRIIHFSQQGDHANVSEIGVSDRHEANNLYNTRAIFKIVRELYNELFNAIGSSLHELFKYMGIDERNRVETDLTNNGCLAWDPNEAYIHERILLTYRDFFTYGGRDLRGIVSVQFLAALNIFLGGDSELSRDAMSELFHNLSWQALTSDNDRYQIQFDTISTLTQSINQRLQRLVMEHRRQTKNLND